MPFWQALAVTNTPRSVTVSGDIVVWAIPALLYFMVLVVAALEHHEPGRQARHQRDPRWPVLLAAAGTGLIAPGVDITGQLRGPR